MKHLDKKEQGNEVNTDRGCISPQRPPYEKPTLVQLNASATGNNDSNARSDGNDSFIGAS